MILEQHDLHNKNLEESLRIVKQCISWMIKQDGIGCVFIHGKGKHSQNNVAVLKQEIRRFLENHEEIKKHGYLVIKGEDDFAITETLNESHLVVVKEGCENESLGDGKKQQEKARIIYSEEGKTIRKQAKRNKKKRKSTRSNPYDFRDNHFPHWKSISADSVFQNYNEGVAIICEIEWISDSCIQVSPVNTGKSMVSQIDTRHVSQLGPKTKSLRVINNDIPDFMWVYKYCFFVVSDFYDCVIGDTIILYKYDGESEVRAFRFQ